MSGTSRRGILQGMLGGALALLLGRRVAGADEGPRVEAFTLETSEWKKRLPPEAYAVLFEEATERAGTSPLDREKRAGTFLCAACMLPLFESSAKFDSGTGWPSFWKPLDNAIGTSEDRKFFMTRTEVHCRRCGGHIGHVFDDGPPPTGLRYCMNGVAMKFVPKAQTSS